MKKWYLMLLTGIMALMLSACGESAEEIYTKATDASEDMESTEATMDMTQNMDLGDEGTMNVDSSFDVEMTMDPLAMHMDGTTSMGDADDENDNDMDAAMPGMGLDMDTETYLVDDTMYVYNSMMDQWMKTDNDELDAIEELAGQNPDPSEQMEMFEDYADDLSLEKSDDAYIVTLEADGDEYEDLFEELLEENQSTEMLDELGGSGQELLDDAEIDSVDLTMELDKETYELSTYDIDMDMTMKVQGEEVSISQQLEAEYSNINEVDSIEVPDDVKDKAQDAGGMGL